MPKTHVKIFLEFKIFVQSLHRQLFIDQAMLPGYPDSLLWKYTAMPMDISLFSAINLVLTTLPTLHQMRTHSEPSDWSRNRWIGPEPEYM